MPVFVFIVFSGLLAWGAWLLYGARHLIRLGLESYKWPTTEGTVIDSRTDSFFISGVGGTSGSSFGVPVVHKEVIHDYVYEVAGRMYKSNTYCFGGHVENASAAYAIGSKIPVHYSPKDPEVAVLRPGVRFGAAFGLLPIAAAFLWLLLCLYA